MVERLSGQVLSGFGRLRIVCDLTLAVLEPEAVAVELEDVNVVGKAIEQRASQALGGEHARPFVEGQVAGDDNRAAFVALAEDLEQQLGACVWRIADSGKISNSPHTGYAIEPA